MYTRGLYLLFVFLAVVLGACGTFELESDVLSEAQIVTLTPAGNLVSPTATVNTTVQVNVNGVTVALGENVSAYLNVSVTGEISNNCYTISSWTQSVTGDRLVAQPVVDRTGDAGCTGAPSTFDQRIVMDQHGFPLEQLAGGSLMLDVAGVVQPLRLLMAPLFLTPDVPTPESQTITVETFGQMLEEAITTYNYDTLAQMMDDPFDFALWQSQGYSAPAAQAVNDLRHSYLPAGQQIVFGTPPPDLTAVLGPDKSILDIWDPAANAVSAIFTTGWGPDGTTEAFLIISMPEDGVVQWDGIVFAAGELGGFDGPHDGQVISTEAFEQMLAEAITTHNYEWMAQLMDDPFGIALWQSQGYTVSATQAVEDLRQTYLPAGQQIVFGTPPPDLTAVLGPDKSILDIWDPAANAVSAIFTTGWGPDGTTEAFLIISVLDDGVVQWEGIIFASGEFGGFAGQ